MELKEYVGKRVCLTRNLAEANDEGHLAVEIDGVVTVVSPDNSALVIRPRGTSLTLLLEAKEIEEGSVRQVIEAPRQLKPRVLGELTLSNARQHLLTAHWIGLGFVNAKTDEEALEFHSEIDHTGFGHVHQAPDEVDDEADDEVDEDADE